MRSFVICCLHLQNHTILVALVSYFVDETKVTNLSKTMIITIASSKSTTDYALPTRANKNKVKTTLAVMFFTSCGAVNFISMSKTASSRSFLFLYAFVFSVAIL